jgi:outer membrane protein assembly factor BamB
MTAVTCVLVLGAVTARAASAEALAKSILDRVNRPVGLAHLPRCGDGALAVALARAGEGLHVHGQDADAANVASARSAADRHGLLNRRVWIDPGGPRRLLPAGRSCDLVVLTDLEAGELTLALAAEIRRVLHPWYGVAVLGDASGTLDADVLTHWAKTIAPDVSAWGGEETLVVVEAGALAGADNWGHYWHGPDNNPVSTDTAYRLPETVQWTGKPYDATRIDLPTVANGRLFMLWNGHLMDVTFGEAVLPGEEVTLKTHGWQTVMERPLREQRGPMLVARAAGSGVRLWHRRLSPGVWLQVARSAVVAEGDRLLVGDGGTLLVLDQATGKQRRRIDMKCDEIKWIAAADGGVAVLGGPQFSRFPERMRRMEENVTPFRSGGTRLSVLDVKTLQPLWQQQRETGPEAFDPRTPAIADGRLFICTVDGQAEAYDLATGEFRWRVNTGIGHGKEVGFMWDRVSRHPVAGYAVAGLYVLGAPEMDRCAVLSQKDGRAMWDLPRGRRAWAPIPMAFDDLVWFGGSGRDPATGEEKRKVSASLGGCGHFTACPQGIVGLQGLTWDSIMNQAVPSVPGKSACGSGQFVANGLIWRIANGCWHIPEWRGFNIRGPAEKDLPPSGPRLVRSAVPAAPRGDARGWTAYRANTARSASVSARVGDKAELLWRVSLAEQPGSNPPDGGILLGPRIVPVPPVTAGSTVVVGNNDGTIRAFNLQTGERLWVARTSGRIQSPPTAWRDRLFVGSADGYVYAFALDDGRQLWRLRVAPEAGRIMLFDQLGSRWPVLAAPLVADGKVFAVAGFMHCLDGLCAVAADAVTGQILWERTDWTDADGEMLSPGRTLGGTGQLCWDDEANEVVYSAGEGLPVRLSARDGQARAAYARGRIKELSTGRDGKTIRAFTGLHYAAGQDIGKFGSGWMVLGGSRMMIDQPAHNASRKAEHFFSQAPNGDGRFPMLNAQGCLQMPAWDRTDVLLTLGEPKRRISLGLAPRSGLEAFFTSRTAGAGEELEWMIRDANVDEDSLLRWRVGFAHLTSPVACALTGDAALVLTTNSRAGQSGLSAYSRADGRELWQVDLPSAPVYNGLAVSADGRVVVALQDGTILCVGEPLGGRALRSGNSQIVAGEDISERIGPAGTPDRKRQ